MMNRAIKILAICLIALMLSGTVLTLTRPQSEQGIPLTQRQADGRAPAQALQPLPEHFIGQAVTPTIRPPLTTLPLYQPDFRLDREVAPRLSTIDNIDLTRRGVPGIDPLLGVQARVPTAVSAFLTPTLNLDGIGYTAVNPPDTVGDVGLNHYIQMVNGNGGSVLNIYNKTGALLLGPVALAGWGGGTGACASGWSDPIVLYDQQADRWLMSEFATVGNHLCVYISDDGNPVTASWYAYDFVTPGFPDYPKYAVWPDAYYVSTNENVAVYALDRENMLLGNVARPYQRFNAPFLSGFPFQALIPSDLDGATLPPAGSPNYFMRHRDDEVHNPGSNDTSQDFLEIWEFSVDFDTPTNSTFQHTQNIGVAEFDSDLCGLSSFECFPQPGSMTELLDPLREVIMWRLQYRNYDPVETLVANFVTDVDGTDHGGIRWFELHKTGPSTWSLYQEGTLAPDSDNRWLGSAALDGSGNLALGYSVVSSSQYPAIRYAGRLVSDTLGTLPYLEGSIREGAAANGSERWGDYSAMTVDPVDDCTFWYTNLYNETSQWQTAVATFSFPECTGSIDYTFTYLPLVLRQ